MYNFCGQSVTDFGFSCWNACKNFYNQLWQDDSWFNIIRGYITEVSLGAAFASLASEVGIPISFGCLLTAESVSVALNFFSSFENKAKLSSFIASSLAAYGCAEVMFVPDEAQYVPAPALFAAALLIQAIISAQNSWEKKSNILFLIPTALRSNQAVSVLLGLIYGIKTPEFMWNGAASSFCQILFRGYNDYFSWKQRTNTERQPLESENSVNVV